MVDPVDTGTLLRITRTIAASRDKVFQAWTEPEQLKKWWGMSPQSTVPIAEVDLKVGGSYRLAMKNPDDDTHIIGGVFQEIAPPEKLVFTWVWEGMPMAPGSDKDMLVTVEFQERGDSTELILTHEFFPNDQAREEHNKGWAGVLDNLARVLEA